MTLTMPVPVSGLFVYGTLQRGQSRENCWPHPPTKIEMAVIQGRLYDLGPHPALVEGDDVIGGELWHISPGHIVRTLVVLDEVEDAAVGQSGLYVRRVVNCRTEDGQDCPAYAYFYSQPEAIRSFPRVSPGKDGVCRWPGDECG
jgi:gamma-glutamylcyclotransferase (GGCT)/AIG2-like uncharacterized protein YtfP